MMIGMDTKYIQKFMKHAEEESVEQGESIVHRERRGEKP